MSTFSSSRRRFLIGSAFAGALAGAGLVAPRTAFAGQKVLLIGDSMIATAFGKYLADGLTERAGYAVHRRGKSSSGLSRPDFFDWITEAKKLAGSQSPACSVVMLGGNDAQAIFVAKGKWIQFDDADAWGAEYRARIDRLIEVLSPAGQPVIFLGLPPMRSPGFNRKIEKINGMLAEAATKQPHVHFVRTNDIIGQDGRFTADLPYEGKTRKVRAEDGIHLTVDGARLLETGVVERIRAIVG